MSPEQAIETAFLILLPDIEIQVSCAYHAQTFRSYRPNIIICITEDPIAIQLLVPNNYMYVHIYIHT